jgi:cell division transport system permease protein
MTKSHKININDYSPNIFLEFGRGVKLGLINFWRNKLLTLATILVVAVMLCILNSILAVNQITKNALQTLNQKVDIVFYLKGNIDFHDANALKEKISSLPGVQKVEYISKQQALEIISKTYPETTDFLTKFNLENPLPASISITTEKAEDHLSVINYIKKSRFAEMIDFNQNNTEKRNDQEILSATTSNLIYISNFVKQLIFWIVFIFLIGGSLIIINAIQLTIYTRKNEIYIMRLVGATPNFIRLPFITEGVCYAVLSVFFSYVLIFIVSKILGIDQMIFSEILANVNIANLIITEIGLTILLSIISSFSTVESYLKQKLNFS